jgi:hypothetical protein
MKENWRPIRGFRYYEVSDQGRVRSLDRRVRNPLTGGWSIVRGRVLKPTADKSGSIPYLYVDLYHGGKRKRTRVRVHNIVAQAFLGPRPKGQHTLHGKNGVADNSVRNLRYGTATDNLLDRRRDGTTPGRKVRCIEMKKTFPSIRQAAEQVLGSTHRVTAIRRVCDGNQQVAGGYRWRYAA